MVWLSSLDEILSNMCIVIICLPACDVFQHDQKVRIKSKYLKNENSF